MLEVRNSRLELIFLASRCETKLTGRDLYEKIKGLKSLMIIGRDNTFSKIYGGYNPKSWSITTDECEEVETYHSFIFLIDAVNLKDYKIARPINYGRSLTNNPDWGPGFGNSDLQITCMNDMLTNQIMTDLYEKVTIGKTVKFIDLVIYIRDNSSKEDVNVRPWKQAGLTKNYERVLDLIDCNLEEKALKLYNRILMNTNVTKKEAFEANDLLNYNLD
ncbi:5505_t:CDS:2 [Dentiscutata erythropus]|uniref:5505_t:CDS:1 n=1 Tax=Dentiscutata erythropus TaxID=1348616 RepID=A0A9N9K6M7_9GLOM|nr:5505_t:CDS:2 [Dentiscutata erythropus]